MADDEPFNPFALLRPAGVIKSLYEKHSGIARTKAIIDEIEKQDAREVFVLAETLKKKIEGLEASISEDAGTVAKASSEFAAAAFGAAPTKKRALQQLTIRRFDPNVPRDMREMWFKQASALHDHEIAMLLQLREGTISFNLQHQRAVATDVNSAKNQVNWSAPGNDPRTLQWDTNTWATNLVAMRALLRDHPDLVTSEDLYRQYFDNYALTLGGRMLVDAMTAYDQLVKPSEPAAT